MNRWRESENIMRKKLLIVLAAFMCFALTPVAALAGEVALDISEGSIVINRNNYTVGGGGQVNYPSGTVFVIFGVTDQNTITVSSSVTANITLGNRIGRKPVNVDVSGPEKCAFDIERGATVNLTLFVATENKLKSGGTHAGLHVPAGAAINIIDEGELEATGGFGGAGIGGSSGEAAGKITIGKGIARDPAIEATGGGGGAGIGGGAGGASGNITINNYRTVATGGPDGGAGIGNGSGGAGGVITINKGMTEAVGGGSGGIGIDGATVNIRDGTVTASSAVGGQALRAGRLNMASRYSYLASTTNPPDPNDTWKNWPGDRVPLKADPAFKYVEIAAGSGSEGIESLDESGGGGGGCDAGAGGFILLAAFFMFVHQQKKSKTPDR